MKKTAKNYFKFMLKKLKDTYKGKYKTPLQMPEKERKDFFKDVKKEWEAHKKESHVRQLEEINKDSLNDYFSYYLSNFNIKDIDISNHMDRMDLSMWVHGSRYMYNINASYSIDMVGEVMLEVYKETEGLGKSFVFRQTYPKLEQVIDQVKFLEE